MDPSSRDAGLVYLFRRELWHPVSFLDFAPSSVYHYTTASAFAGVVADATIRATNFTFLNDPSEVKYGHDLILQLLADIRAGACSDEQILLDAMTAALNEEMLAEVYVSCFSALPDDLSQWRAYASAAVERYSIGFDFEALEALGNSDATISFAKVLYETDEQIPRAQFYIDRALRFVKNNNIDRQHWAAVAGVAAELLARVVPELKNSAYAHEKEWRLIRWHRIADTSDIHFDTSRCVLRPYVTISLPTPVPLSDVRLMAPTRRDVALKGAEMLLVKFGVRVEITHSKIPFVD